MKFKMLLVVVLLILVSSVFTLADESIPVVVETPAYDWSSTETYTDLDYNTFDWSSTNMEGFDWNNVNWGELDWATVDNGDLGSILQENPAAMDDPDFFVNFDSKVKDFSSDDFSTFDQSSMNSWISKRSEGGFSLGEGGSLSGYDGSMIQTSGDMATFFDVDSTPEGSSFEVQEDGSLKSTGDKFPGSYSGNIFYDSSSGVLDIADGSYTDASKNQFGCGSGSSSSGCNILVSEDGSIQTIFGDGELTVWQGDNEWSGLMVEVSNIQNVVIDEDGIVHAQTIPDEGPSFVGGAVIETDDEFTYDARRSEISGSHITVVESQDVIFTGFDITFEHEGEAVANLGAGTAIFTDDRIDCGQITSCIVYNPTVDEVFVQPEKNSKIEVIGSEGRDIVTGMITDESRVIVTQDNNIILGVDKYGMHPRVDLKDTGMAFRSEYADVIIDTPFEQRCDGSGCQFCLENACQEVAFSCVA